VAKAPTNLEEERRWILFNRSSTFQTRLIDGIFFIRRLITENGGSDVFLKETNDNNILVNQSCHHGFDVDFLTKR
jgi:hypothetical protein